MINTNLFFVRMQTLKDRYSSVVIKFYFGEMNTF